MFLSCLLCFEGVKNGIFERKEKISLAGAPDWIPLLIGYWIKNLWPPTIPSIYLPIFLSINLIYHLFIHQSYNHINLSTSYDGRENRHSIKKKLTAHRYLLEIDIVFFSAFDEVFKRTSLMPWFPAGKPTLFSHLVSA